MINMKALHTVPRKSFINVKFGNASITLFFDHIDGAYSYCKNKEGSVVHISAWALVEVVDKPEDWDKE